MDAISLYEKAFGVKVKYSYYKDTPASNGYRIPHGAQNYIMHAQFNIGTSTITLCDAAPNTETHFGNGIAIHVQLNDKNRVRLAFDTLKAGGNVGMDLQKTPWCKYFGSLEDQFGVGWILSLAE